MGALRTALYTGRSEGACVANLSPRLRWEWRSPAQLADRGLRKRNAFENGLSVWADGATKLSLR